MLYFFVLFSLVFLQQGTDVNGVRGRLGFLFFALVNISFAVVSPLAASLPLERSIIRRERAAGTYRASSAFAALFFSILPTVSLGVATFSIPVYWFVGLQIQVQQYFVFLFVMYFQGIVSLAIGLAIGSYAPNPQVGAIFAPMVLVVCLLFGGLLLNLNNSTWVLRWLKYLSHIHWSYNALAQNEFTGLLFNCIGVSGACYPTGQNVIDSYALNDLSLWWSELANLGLFLSWIYLGYLAFSSKSRPLSRLV